MLSKNPFTWLISRPRGWIDQFPQSIEGEYIPNHYVAVKTTDSKGKLLKIEFKTKWTDKIMEKVKGESQGKDGWKNNPISASITRESIEAEIVETRNHYQCDLKTAYEILKAGWTRHSEVYKIDMLIQVYEDLLKKEPPAPKEITLTVVGEMLQDMNVRLERLEARKK